VVEREGGGKGGGLKSFARAHKCKCQQCSGNERERIKLIEAIWWKESSSCFRFCCSGVLLDPRPSPAHARRDGRRTSILAPCPFLPSLSLYTQRHTTSTHPNTRSTERSVFSLVTHIGQLHLNSTSSPRTSHLCPSTQLPCPHPTQHT